MQSRIGHAGFMALKKQVTHKARTQAKRGNSATLTDKAQKAAVKQQAEAASRAVQATMDRLQLANTGIIEAVAFKQALTAKLAQVMAPPKSGADAQKALDHKTGLAINDAMKGELAARQGKAKGDLPTKMGEVDKPGDHMPPPPPELVQSSAGPRPGAPGTQDAAPPPLPDSALDTSADRADADAQYASENITQTQLKRSNEPSFVDTAKARDDADAHSEAGPPEVRAAEAGIAHRARVKGASLLLAGMNMFAAARLLGFGAVFGQQTRAKTKEEKERERVSDTLQKIQNRTRDDVETLLSSMEWQASFNFNLWLDYALAAFDTRREKLEKRIRDHKGEEALEQGDVIGAAMARWGDLDKYEIETAINGARRAYDEVVAKGIDQVATFVGNMLALAKDRIRRGRAEAQIFVGGLKGAVAAFGVETLVAIEGEFETMSASVDSRRDGLIDRLGEAYADSQRKVEEHAQAFRDANKSWWQRLKEKVKGVIRAIRQIKDLFFSILARVSGIITDILSDPGGFFSTLIDGAKRGFNAFRDKIATYVEKALFQWAFGELAAAGINLPDRYDAKGIFGMIASILGLTIANVRARAVKLIGVRAVAAIEGTAEVFRVLVSEGPMGLWDMLAPKLEQAKDQAISMIQELLIVKVIKAGVIWVLSLMNPASGFVRACKAIYALISFFVERAAQIVELVNAVLDSLADAVTGNVAAVAQRVESALANALSLVIGLLANVLGLGGMGAAIRGIIERIRAPVDRAIDWLLGGTLKLAKSVGSAVMDRVAGRPPKPPEEKPAAAAPVPLPADEVKERAREQLFARLKSDHSRQEAVGIVATIAAELQPLGLKRLFVEEPDAEGRSRVIATASPDLPLGELLSELETRPGRVSVKSVIQVTLGQALTMPNTPQRSAAANARRYYGGEVWSREKEQEAGAEKSSGLNMISWNTDYMSDATSNHSHAEHQFAHFMEGRKPLWPAVEKIVIVNYTRSPCGGCSAELGGLLAEISAARKKPIGAHIYWTTLHTGVSPTSWDSLRDLKSRGWSIHATADALPQSGVPVHFELIKDKPRTKK